MNLSSSSHFQSKLLLWLVLELDRLMLGFNWRRSELHQLIKRELDFWARKAKDKHGVDLTWDGQVLDALCLGYNVAYGARSIKYEVERNVVSLLSNTQQFYGFPRDALLQLYVHYSGKGDDKADNEAAHQPEIRLRIKSKDSPEFTEIASPLRPFYQHQPDNKTK